MAQNPAASARTCMELPAKDPMAWRTENNQDITWEKNSKYTRTQAHTHTHTHARTHTHTQPHLTPCHWAPQGKVCGPGSPARWTFQILSEDRCTKNLKLATDGWIPNSIISQPDTWRAWSLSQYWAIGLGKNMLTYYMLTKMGSWERYVMQTMLRPRVTTGIRLVFWDRSSSCQSGLWTDWMAMASPKKTPDN